MRHPPSKASSEDLDRILFGEKTIHKAILEKLFKELENKIEFTVKVQKASVLLIADIPFSVIGFRKNGNRLFMEFYSDEKISSQSAKETGQRGGRLIYRVSLNGINEINEELIKWIVNSQHLTHTTKP